MKLLFRTKSAQQSKQPLQKKHANGGGYLVAMFFDGPRAAEW